MPNRRNRKIPIAALTLVVGLALAGRPARGQTAIAPSGPNAAIGQGQPGPPASPETRSISGAVFLSIAGTLGGIAAVAALAHDPERDTAAAGIGFVLLSFGPSAGELYAGGYRRALVFSSLRGLCSGLFLYEYVSGHLGGEVANRDASDDATIAILGLLGLSVISIVDAGLAADDFNRLHRPPRGFDVAVAPLITPARTADGIHVGLDAGLTLAGHF
jgi:hypothetical protein